MDAIDRLRIWGPASLSNLGPGFDTLGVCLEGLGDVVEIWKSDAPGVAVQKGGGPWEPPSEPEKNTAGRAAQVVLERLAPGAGLALRIHKGILPGSGLGSSAASAAAAAWGAVRLLAPERGKRDAVEAALVGESIVSGARHGDNVLPALFGGVVLVSATDPTEYRRVPVPVPMHFAVIRPQVRILTKAARAMLPDRVSLSDAVRNASSLGFLVDALRAGDMETVGRMIETDRLVEPVRATLVPGFGAIRAAAKEAGAFGAALSGSGPAVFAVCPDAQRADAVLSAMRAAAAEAGLEARGVVCGIDRDGARATPLTSPPTVL